MKKIIYLKTKSSNRLLPTKSISLALIASGSLLIILAIWPILSFNLFIAPKFAGLIKPVPDSVLVKSSQTLPKRTGFFSAKGNIVEAQEEQTSNPSPNDYTKANIWFPKKPAIQINQPENQTYALSIPKLKIKDALVIIGGEDLNKSLIHYGGTAYPGEYGNTVIFGHSVLPYFFNPKDYKTIFSTLPSLDEGDEIFVNFEGITYRYVVEEMHVVNPEDVSVLEQRYDDSYISLITCVPPGTYEKRLWVKGRLQKI